jgi:hypothetical protein
VTGVPNIWLNKPRKIRWTGHAAQKASADILLVAKSEGKKPLGKVGVCVRLMSCLVLKKQDRTTGTGCIQLTEGCYWERIVECLVA